MKNKLHAVCLFLLFIIAGQVKAQNLPSPPANNVVLPEGSLIIAMDNTNQTNSINMFNLRAYGLVVHLLNNNIKLKWIIKSGKLKDGSDILVSGSRYRPTSSAITNLNFKSGPFVINAEDTLNVAALIDAYNTSLATNDRVKVYQTNVPAIVDERYNLTNFKPKAALLDNGGNFEIHRDYLIKAGITFGMNSSLTAATNWERALVIDMMSNCFTFGSEAHWDEDDASITTSVMNDVREFLMAGGNMLAECAAVRTYENYGRFHSTGGINPLTENEFNSALTTLNYVNADLSYSQFEGPVNIDKGGSLKNWTYNGNKINQTHDHAEGPVTDNNIGASVSKVGSTSGGGLMFYLGNHKYDRVDELEVLNGIRMYLNAFLTPPNNNNNICLTLPTPNYQNGEMCFTSMYKAAASTNVSWNYDAGNQTYTIRATLNKDYVDNTYGIAPIGWGLKGHKFADMVSSEFLHMILNDNNGLKRMEFRIDYLSASTDVPSGFKTLGVTGGDGSMMFGNPNDIVSIRTSLDANFNEYGYVLPVNSPATNAYYSQNPMYPYWNYDVWYEVTVKANAFGSAGIGNPTIKTLNASPSKLGTSSEAVTIGNCPVRVFMGEKGVKNQVVSGLNIYPNPVKTNLNLSFSADKQTKASIKILDFAGKTVFTNSIIATPGLMNKSFDISKLKIGMYTLQLITETNVLNQKFFVIK